MLELRLSSDEEADKAGGEKANEEPTQKDAKTYLPILGVLQEVGERGDHTQRCHSGSPPQSADAHSCQVMQKGSFSPRLPQ